MPALIAPLPDWPLIVEDLLHRADQLSQAGAPDDQVDELLAAADKVRISRGRIELLQIEEV